MGAAGPLISSASPSATPVRAVKPSSAAAAADAGLSTALVVVNRIGRSGRKETLPSAAVPLLRVPQIETFEGDRESGAGEDAPAGSRGSAPSPEPLNGEDDADAN